MRAGSAHGLLAVTLLTAGLTVGCAFVPALDPFCEDGAKDALSQLERAVLPHLDKADLASVERIDGCDSGDGPYLSIAFRPGVAPGLATSRLRNASWRRPTADEAEWYKAELGPVLYLRKADGERLMIITEEPAPDEATPNLAVEFVRP